MLSPPFTKPFAIEKQIVFSVKTMFKPRDNYLTILKDFDNLNIKANNFTKNMWTNFTYVLVICFKNEIQTKKSNQDK